jgi:hypothetical protein
VLGNDAQAVGTFSEIEREELVDLIPSDVEGQWRAATLTTL